MSDILRVFCSFFWMPLFVSGTQGLLELLWMVFSEEKLQSRLKLRNLQNPFHKKK